VYLLGDLGRHLASGRPAPDEAFGIALPEDVAFDLDQAHDRLGSVVVCGEAEVDRGLPVSEFRDQRDGAVVVHAQIDPSVGRLDEPASVHT
jgi:hypothetical protein